MLHGRTRAGALLADQELLTGELFQRDSPFAGERVGR